MAGKPGRGGQNRLSLAEHLTQGTFRRDRHAEKFTSSIGQDPTPAAPPRAILDGLRAPGRRFMRALYSQFHVNPVEAIVARLCGESLDDLDAARRAGDSRGGRAARREFLSAYAKLNLPVERPL
jgi:hypothetical protein